MAAKYIITHSSKLEDLKTSPPVKLHRCPTTMIHQVFNIFTAYSETYSAASISDSLIAISQMVAAFPAGYLCDVFRRDSVLKAGAVLGLAAGTILATVLLLRLPIWTLFLAMASLGSYSGFQGPPIESIFADSVSLGERCERR